MAHAPLLRNNTSPVLSQSHGFAGISSTMSNAPRGSQLSGSTAYNSSSASLSSLSTAATTIPTPSPGNIIPTANIINQKADASRSLYHLCMSLKARLALVPDFDEYLQQLDPLDPVESLWGLFRTGYPLLAIYNALQPDEPLKVEDPNASESKKSKIALFKFIQGCLKELNIPAGECFVISDVLGNDTTGFVKVTQVVNFVLDLAQQRGLLLQVQPYPEDEPTVTEPGLKLSTRDYIVREIVTTERKYVQDLENLHDLKSCLETKGIVTGDTIHQIFLNINAILDFQRRFLIRVETTNSMPTSSQQWGAPFVTFEDGFDIYRPFIANQRKAAQVANQVFEQIRISGHPVAVDFNTLDSFLLKPMQRLVKYPLLLKDLLKHSQDDNDKADLSSGIEVAGRILTKANEEVNREVLDEALEDLRNRVDDWKNHRVEQFGKLLLHGVYTVVTGKSEQEKDYEIYLFECILLCCKEVSPNKSKDKKDKTKSTGPRMRNRNARLQLKGRIFMTNVTDIVTLSKPGSYSVQIWWKGDPGIENFMIKFSNEEILKKWASGLEVQRKENAPKAASPDATPPEFAWTREHGSELKNPYIGQQDEDEEDDEFGHATESPTSSRASTASSMAPPSAYPFPKSGTPQPGWGDEQNRNPRGPSLPAMASASQSAAQQQRSRSYSTPDINVPGIPPSSRRNPSGQGIPVPGVPAHLHPAHDNNIPRSQTGSPRLNDLPIRSNTQSPGAQRERQYSHQSTGSYGGTMSQFPAQPLYHRQGTPSQQGYRERNLSIDATAASNKRISPPLGTAGAGPGGLASPELVTLPTQLKVKVNIVDSGNYVTLVVAFNITYQSLIDRIDAKLARFTNSSISKGMLKLRYQDEDGDFVTIESDDDIQIAILEWREGTRVNTSGGVGEIELFCVGDTSSVA